MTQEGTKVQSEKKQYTAEEFANKFQELCEEYGYQLIATPVWLARDDSTFSMKINWSVGKLPQVDRGQVVV